MKTQCPHCKAIQKVPEAYKDKDVKCLHCKKLFVAQEFHKPPIVVPDYIARKGGNFIGKIWKGSPNAFRTGFLTTLGVICALIVSFYVYSHIIMYRPTIEKLPIEAVQKQLSKCGLFPISLVGLPGFFQGRYLFEYRFFPDATCPDICLSVWTDRTSKDIVGIKATWLGFDDGKAAQIKADKNIFYHSKMVCNGFKSLTNTDLTVLPSAQFMPGERNFEFYQKQYHNWFIHISRAKTLNEISEFHEKYCRRTNKDPNTYSFTVFARNNW